MYRPKQTYDAEGTTDFSCSFLERVLPLRKKTQWMLRFTQGFISIYSPYTGLNIALNFPAKEHWVYTDRESEFRSGATVRGAEIKTSLFTLWADVREYLDPEDPAFDPEYDEEGENSGHLDLDINGQHITVDLPYRVALGIITLAAGSTDLEGAMHVRKHKPSFEPTQLNRTRKATMMTELTTLPEMGSFPGGIEYQQVKANFTRRQAGKN
jgi:hypothetical protein